MEVLNILKSQPHCLLYSAEMGVAGPVTWRVMGKKEELYSFVEYA